MAPIDNHEVSDVVGHVYLVLFHQCVQQLGPLRKLSAAGCVRNHEHEPLRGRVMVDERHIDDLAVVEPVQRAPKRRLPELRVSLDVDDTTHLDFDRLAVLAEYANPLHPGATRRPRIRQKGRCTAGSQRSIRGAA